MSKKNEASVKPETTSQTMAMVSLSDLRLDTANVRRDDCDGDDEQLMASILVRYHEGRSPLIVPLVVRPDAKAGPSAFLVTDGGKRMRALLALAKRGSIPQDVPLPCVIEAVGQAEARETSLAANVVRRAMHPVDEFRAFHELHVDENHPLTVAQIAARFGLSERHVEQRLALGALDARLLDAWREGLIDAEVAKAFTLATPKEQVAIWNQAIKQKEQKNLSAWGVRRRILGDKENVGHLLDVVGIDAYQQRGGKVIRDLFGDSHVVSDVELIQTMAQEALAQRIGAVQAEGWAWVMERPGDWYKYGRVPFSKGKPTAAEKKRLGELRKLLYEDEFDENEAYEGLKDEVDTLEQVIALRGVTAKQRAESGAFVYIERGRICVDYGYVPPKGKPDPATKDDDGGNASTKKPAEKKNLSQALVQRLYATRLEAIKRSLEKVAKEEKSPLSALLGRVVASQINPGSTYNAMPNAVRDVLNPIANAIPAKILNAALRDEFDAKDYFGAAPKALRVKAIVEALGHEAAKPILDAKGTEITAFALKHMPKAWLPKELRTANYDGPGAKQ